MTEAVISVPVSFNERQRQAIRDAGAIAGLEIKRIINEPSAVALAYGIRKTKEQLIAVCSMGGGAFEVSILEVSILGGKVVESVGSCGDNHIGGDDLDHRLIDWLVGEFRKDTSIDVGADKAHGARPFWSSDLIYVKVPGTVRVGRRFDPCALAAAYRLPSPKPGS